MKIPPFFYEIYFGNTILDYSVVLGFVLLGFIFNKYLSQLLSSFLYKIIARKNKEVTGKEFDKLLHQPLSRFIMLIILYAATQHLDFPENWNLAPKSEFGTRLILSKIYGLIVITSFTWIILRILDFGVLILERKALKTEGKQDDQIISFAKEIVKIIILVFAFFVVMGEIFSVDIGALIAGLGIGGLALALAAKESLENLLSSFIIFFDKPFLVGDSVKIGSVAGTVEKVGFRSTRVRTIEKSYLTVPNTQMIGGALDNMSLRTFRRVKLTVGLVYGTKINQIKDIVSAIQKALDEHPHTNMDGKAKFTDLGASSLDIMVVYYVDTMNYSIFLDVKEEINFKIMEIVENNGSDFAFPTQTIHIEKT